MMPKLSFSLPFTACVYIALSSSNGDNGGVASALSMQNSRRAFLNRAAAATTGATMGWVLTQQKHPGGCACGQCASQHSASCNCGMCKSGVDNSHVAGCQCGACLVASHDASCSCGMCAQGHGQGCDCSQCGGGLLGFRPQGAWAFEKREIGGDNRSATTAAFNIQNEKTYERLEKGGFPLDTKADEQARLSDALSSFSYPASTTTSNAQKNKARK